MSATEMLRVHRKVWDMPALLELAPEIVEHLAARYEVVFPEDFTGQVYVVTKATGVMEKMGTTDVREAVATLLSREAEAEFGTQKAEV